MLSMVTAPQRVSGHLARPQYLLESLRTQEAPYRAGYPSFTGTKENFRSVRLIVGVTAVVWSMLSTPTLPSIIPTFWHLQLMLLF